MSDPVETKTIWKFPLPDLATKAVVEIDMPARHCPIISVGMQQDVICLWVEHYLMDGKATKKRWTKRRFTVHVTGSEIPLDGREYVGTVHLVEMGIPIVLHLYELK
jgi:hypothetical protein